MNKKQALLTLMSASFSIGALISNAQPGGTTPDPNMLSGSSNAYGINTIYHTSAFDGTANVNVPIFSYGYDEKDYGVSLSYNTKGILVDETENAEGLHWNLAGVCSIERIVKDVPDELNYDSGEDSLYSGDRAFYNKTRYVKGKWATYWETPQQQAMTNVYRDGECDNFVVNLNGESFTFNLGSGLNQFTSPHRNVKISPLINGVPFYSVTNQHMGQYVDMDVLSFQIRDERGNVYLFEIGDAEIRTLYDNTYWDDNVMGTAVPTIRWNLKKVTFADGKEINYRYTHTWQWPVGTGGFTQYMNYFVLEGSDGTNTFMGSKAQDGVIRFSQLLGIDYPNNNTLNFIYDDIKITSSLKKQLKEIQIVSKVDTTSCMRYKFFQSKVNERWFLDSIRLYSCDNVNSEKYFSFEYNDVKLPKRLNLGQDLFGYYNADSVAAPVGTSGTKFNIPKHHYNAGLNYGLGKSYLPFYAQAGLITKVMNAFGGELIFEYTSNTSDIASPFVVPGGTANEKFVGVGTLGMDGVAIHSITEKEKFRPLETTVTVYDYHNSGKLFIPGGYVHYPYYINKTSNVVEKEMYQGLYLTNHQFVNGANHGYSNVGISKFNASGQLLSRNEITFTNISDNLSASRFYKVPGSKELYEYPYSDKQYIKDWEIGLPLEIAEYDNNNRIVQKTINKYDFSAVDLTASSFITNTKTSKVNTGILTTIPFGERYYIEKKIFTDTYYPYTGTALLSKTIVSKYVSDTKSVQDTVEYYYDNNKNLNSIVTKDSKGERTTTNVIFNYQVDGPNNPYGQVNPNTTLYTLGSIGLEKAVSMERWKQSTVNPPYSNTLLDAYILGYSYTNGKLWKKTLFNTEIGTPQTFTQYTGLPAGSVLNPFAKILAAYNTQVAVPSFTKSTDVTLFDNEGNALETRYQDLGKYTAAIFDTATDNMLAQASNARYNEIAYTSFEDIGVPDFWLKRGNLDLNSSKVVNVTGSPTLTSVSGKFIYALKPDPTTGFDFSYINGVQNLTTGKQYTLSFWVNGAVPKVYYGATLLTAPTAPAYEKGVWKNYIFKFTATSAAKIKIAPLAVTVYLDEIRLYPSEALMASWTYMPLQGQSSFTDNSGRIIYYEYDKLGRLAITRDQDGNIIQKITHTIAGGL